MRKIPFAQIALWVHRLNTHDTIEPLYTLAIYLVSLIIEMPHHLTGAVEGVLGVFFIDQLHKQNVFLACRGLPLIIEIGSIEPDQSALTSNAYLLMVGFDYFTLLVS